MAIAVHCNHFDLLAVFGGNLSFEEDLLTKELNAIPIANGKGTQAGTGTGKNTPQLGGCIGKSDACAGIRGEQLLSTFLGGTFLGGENRQGTETSREFTIENRATEIL